VQAIDVSSIAASKARTAMLRAVNAFIK